MARTLTEQARKIRIRMAAIDADAAAAAERGDCRAQEDYEREYEKLLYQLADIEESDGFQHEQAHAGMWVDPRLCDALGCPYAHAAVSS